MKIIIFILIITIGIVGYLIFANLYALYLKKYNKTKDDRDFFNTYKAKYTKEYSYEDLASTSNTFPECLSILGFSDYPDEKTLKSKYRQLAKESHPDKGGDPKDFERYSNAYKEALKILN